MTDLLFPHQYRRPGWWLFITATILGLLAGYGDSMADDWGIQSGIADLLGSYVGEVASLGLITGLLLIAFAREKSEDEMIRQLRLESLQWRIYVNYLLLALAIAFVYDGAFFSVMIYNMFTSLIVFIARFRWSLKRVSQLEEASA